MNTSQPPRWYLAKNKQRLGPFIAEQLRQMAAAGIVKRPAIPRQRPAMMLEVLADFDSGRSIDRPEAAPTRLLR